MAKKNHKASGGTSNAPRTIIIPALEKIAKTYTPISPRWSDEEGAIVLEYYRRISTKDLAEYLFKTFGVKRSHCAIKTRYQRLSSES